MNDHVAHGTRCRTGLNRRHAGSLVLGAAAAVALGPKRVAAADRSFFRIATGSTGNTAFQVGGVLANAVSNPEAVLTCGPSGGCGVPGLLAVSQGSSGSIANIAELRAGAAESALTQSDVAHWAHVGTGPFPTAPGASAPGASAPGASAHGPSALRAIASLYVAALHLVVPAESSIRTVQDLVGHRVSMGHGGSGTLENARRLLALSGIDPNHVVESSLRPNASADALVDGMIDAAFIADGAPVPAVAEAARRRPMRLVPIELPPDRLHAMGVGWTAHDIAAGTYEQIDATRTIGVSVLWVTRADVDDGLVQAITRSLWHAGSRALLEAGHPVLQGITVAGALKHMSIPMHPGAQRFYDELGLRAADVAHDATDALPPTVTR